MQQNPLSGQSPAASGPPQALILLPGLLCDRALWAPVLQRLALPFPAIVPELTHQNRVEDLARHVLATAPERCAVAGLSMGGYVAQALMSLAPERITHLALINTSARADTDEQKERRRLLLAMARAGQFKGVTPRLLPLLIHPARLADTALTQEIMHMAERVGREAFFSQQEAIMHRVDRRGQLPQWKTKALVIGGAQDALTPPDITQEIARLLPQAEYHLLPDCGHLSPLEKPDAVAELMRDWLAG